MIDPARKKSPRAPSMALNEAIDRAVRIYEKERRNAAPTDVIAQNLGYKSANNGAALAVIASLRYFGLLEKAGGGKLAVSKDVESYKFAPNDELRFELQKKWLRSPSVFADLLERYESGLPSDATLRFDLIQSGFNPATAESVIAVFKQSVDFADYFGRRPVSNDGDLPLTTPVSVQPRAQDTEKEKTDEVRGATTGDNDRIPVRLSGGRRAWLEIPTPFFSADKKRLKAQIDLLLTEDDEETSSGDE